jgi:predicted nicotinamide N-methyase
MLIFDPAMPAVTRMFSIPLPSGSLDIFLHEPSLTADNLGLKTWGASFLLAQRLAQFKIPSSGSNERLRVLELGSGTGLVGIAAAAVLGANVHLTDLPEIVPNLSRNVQDNEALIAEKGGIASTGALDWSVQYDDPLSEYEKYPLILATDPLYSPEHPKFLAQTVGSRLQKTAKARFVVELPLREEYTKERTDFAHRMEETGLVVEEDGEEFGFDDWQSKDGDLIGVQCWWAVFRWKEPKGE